MPACFPRRKDAIVPWVDGPVGEALPSQRWVQLPDATWVFTTSDQKVACGFGRWTTDCGLPSCSLWGRSGLWIYTTEGSWSSASAPDHRYVSAVRWSYAAAGVPRLQPPGQTLLQPHADSAARSDLILLRNRGHRPPVHSREFHASEMRRQSRRGALAARRRAARHALLDSLVAG